MRKTKLICMMALAGLMLMTGCGSNEKASMTTEAPAAYATNTAGGMLYDMGDYDMAYDDVIMYEESEAGDGWDARPADTGIQQNDSARKLIRNVSLSVETKDYEGFLNNVENTITSLGGYIEYMDMKNSSLNQTGDRRTARSASITARIPAESLNSFVDTVGETSNVTNRSENVQDITLTYVDMDSHKRMLEAEQENLLELMEQCETVEDMIALESRLTEVRYQIESMASQLRTYDNLVDYSTVQLSVSEVLDYTPVVTIEKTAGERIKEGFSNNLSGVLNGFKEFFIWIIIHLPGLVVFAAFVIAGILIVKAIIKSNRRKKEKLYAQRMAAYQAQNPAMNQPPIQPVPVQNVPQNQPPAGNKN